MGHKHERGNDAEGKHRAAFPLLSIPVGCCNAALVFPLHSLSPLGSGASFLFYSLPVSLSLSMVYKPIAASSGRQFNDGLPIYNIDRGFVASIQDETVEVRQHFAAERRCNYVKVVHKLFILLF